MQTLSNDKILELLAKLVGQYLADNGGYSNQYDTYVKGIIIPNKLGGITEFRSPGNYGKTKDHIKSLGDGLEKEIKKLLHLYDFETTVVLDAEYQGDGSFFQKVSVLQTRSVVIPDINPVPSLVITNEETEEEKNHKKQKEIEAENKRKLDQEDEDQRRRQRRSDDDLLLSASMMSSIASIM